MDLLRPDFGLFFWQTVTFGVVLLVLSKFAWVPIINIIERRESDIRVSLDNVKNAEIFLKGVSEEHSKIIGLAKIEREKILQEAERSRNIILDASKKEAADLLVLAMEKAKSLIKEERLKEEELLRSTVASLSVKIAEKLIMTHLSIGDEQNKLIKGMIDRSSLSISK